MSLLLLIEGPAGSGKSQVVSRMLAAGELDVLADYTAIWAAVRAVERDNEGRYPVRQDSDPAVRSGLVPWVRAAVARQGLRLGLRVAVTSGSPGMATKWQQLAREEDALFALRTIDPGIDVVKKRLAVDGDLSPECERAIGRWYS